MSTNQVYHKEDVPDSGIPLAEASHYLARGWSVIPVEPQGKRPLIPWVDFQRRLPTTSELAAWSQRWPSANVGIITGHLSGLLVLDIDGPEGRATAKALCLPRTLASRTGGGGWHVFFRHPATACRNFTRRLPGLDLRGDGGFVVAPPSVHVSGRTYKWYLPPDEVSLADPPHWLVDLAQRQPTATARPPEYWRNRTNAFVAKGRRNDSLCRLTGYLLAKGIDPVVALDLTQRGIAPFAGRL